MGRRTLYGCLASRMLVYGVAAVILFGQAPVQASAAQPSTNQCFLDDEALQANAPELWAQQRQFAAIGFSPLEYRRSCALQTEDDQQYYDWAREFAGCGDSATYDALYGRFLKDPSFHFMSSAEADIATPALFTEYCALVAQIDLAAFFNEDGSPNWAATDAHRDTFDKIIDFVRRHGVRRTFD